MAHRRPTDAEVGLIRLLVNRAEAGVMLPFEWEQQLLVEALKDGGMGSLRLILGADQGTRFGSVASEFEFLDVDGVKVLASLYLDEHRMPLEIDLWRTDFSPLRALPVSHEASSE